MPFGFIQDQESAVNYNLDWQWWGEKEEGVRQMIRAALKENYRVMLKPQLWLKGGKYTGQLSFEKNADWKILEASYRDFILDFAHLAAEEKVDLFCIGTELEQFTQERSYFWKQLIKEIKEVYQGPLTYASNWDEYQEVPFWQELDLIGIDAYFPLTKKTEPTKKELNKAMRVYSRELKQFSLEKGKPILFTEYGYCSKKGTTIEPWKHDRNAEVDLEAQTLALECFYDTFWEEEYIAGGFLWKWFPNHTKVGGKNHPGFTPQNKPAEKVVFQAYKEFN
ncbi:MAG: glycoside hydrolase TIM-barrel-like domain-containing protein [Vicingaceae bacterium]